jgi:ammonia channel protein AmtB
VIIGLLAGILSPLVLYVAETYLYLRDTAAAITLGLVGGLWGTLAVALFADGRWGQGWNQIAPYTGSGESPLGIAGIFTGGGAEQFIAQVVGLLALGAWGLLWGAILGFIAHPSLPKFKLPAGMQTKLTDLGSSSADEESDEEKEASAIEATSEVVGGEEAPTPAASEPEEEEIPFEPPTATEEITEIEEGES